MKPVETRREVTDAIQSFGMACSGLCRHSAYLPAPLLKLVDALHALVNVQGMYLERPDPSPARLLLERDAWDAVREAWAARPGQDGAT